MIDKLLLIVATLALGVIIYIISKKLPQLANLEVSDLPEEKINRKKKEIINSRIEKTSVELKEGLKTRFEPIRKIWGKVQLQFRIYVGKVERLLHYEQAVKAVRGRRAEKARQPDSEDQGKFNNLLQGAEQHLGFGNYEQAESMFIAAIKLNPKSASAYRGLGDTYAGRNSIEEARQTYRFVLKLDPDDDSTLVKLADIAESQGDLEEAIQYYQQAILINDSFSPRFYHLAELLVKVDQVQVAKEAIMQAVELEPQNPKYLDLLIEIAIICGDKDLAFKAFNDLRLVNPDNQKLDTFKERIGRIDASFSLVRH